MIFDMQQTMAFMGIIDFPAFPFPPRAITEQATTIIMQGSLANQVAFEGTIGGVEGFITPVPPC